MKSELLGPSKVKSPASNAIPKRRMSKNSAMLENGAELATLAVEELKCNKQVEFQQSASQMDEKNDFQGTTDITTGDQAQGGKEEPQETRRLKELLLLHLDLVQQQQELLMAKDRQIQTLRGEKEALKCRLERMERRMSLLRQRGENAEPPFSPADNSSTKSVSPAPSIHRLENRNRGIKRKSSLEPINLNKRLSFTSKQEKHRPYFNRFKHHTPRTLPLRDSTPRKISPSFKTEPETKQQEEPQLNNSILDDELVQPVRTGYPSICGRGKRRGRPPRSRQRKSSENVLRTDTLYYVPDFKETVVVQTESCQGATEKEPQVHVPQWRWNPIQTGYQMEGTENLDDEIFLKRHQKPEQEEKRRKRWDLQRLREQQLHLRQQQKRDSSSKHPYSNTNNHIHSFLPDPDKVEYIEVCEAVSVNAFGYPIPKLEQVDFQLPWCKDGKKESEEKTKSTRGKWR